MTTCYQCEKEVGWLAPDSRCGQCTRLTVDEIKGEVSVEPYEWELAGTVSSGTLRPYDLSQAFLGFLSEHFPDEFQELEDSGDLPGHESRENDGDPYWTSEDCVFYMEELFEKMESLAYEGYHFGAHPGNGSDFGYWENEE